MTMTFDAIDRALHLVLEGDDPDQVLHEMPGELADEVRALLPLYGPFVGGKVVVNGVDRREPETPWAGRRVGAFTIERLIGEGGMGRVFLATQDAPRRPVALKVIRRSLPGKTALKRFELEAELMSRLNHPNVVKVIEAGVHHEDGVSTPYFAMEYLENAVPILEYVNNKGLTGQERIRLFVKVCDAVDHGHQKGIIHRDLKPDNILIDESGEPKVIDFGVARTIDSESQLTSVHTDVQQLIGTLPYMSPEQIDGKPDDISLRSDVYSLGIVLYQLLTDSMPYDLSNSSPVRAIEIIRGTSPTPPSAIDRRFRGDLQKIMLHALKKSPEMRYQTVAALGDDLRRWLNHEPIHARGPSLAYALSFLIRRNKTASLGAAAALIAVVAVVLFLQGKADRLEAAAEKARADDRAYVARVQYAAMAIERNDGKAVRRVLLDDQDSDWTKAPWEARHLIGRADLSMKTLVASLSDNLRKMPVQAIACDPVVGHHRFAVAYSDGSLGCRIHDTETGELLRTLLWPRDDATVSSIFYHSIAWAPDGEWVATAGDIHRARDGEALAPRAFLAIWNAETGQRLDSLEGLSPSAINSMAVNGKDAVIACGFADGGISLWRYGPDTNGALRINRECATIQKGHTDSRGHSNSTSDLDFSPDGTYLASAGHSDRTARLWDVSKALSGSKSSEIAVCEGHTYHVRSVAFNSTGTMLATGSMDNTCRIWNVESITERHRNQKDKDQVLKVKADAVTAFANQGIWACDFAHDDCLVVGRGDGSIGVCQLRGTGGPQRTAVLRGHDDHIRHLIADGDGRVITGSEDGSVRLWDPNVREVPTLQGHKSSVSSSVWLGGGPRLLSSAIIEPREGNGSLILWNAHSGKKVRHVVHEGMIERIAASSDRVIAVTANEVDKDIALLAWTWDQENQNLSKTPTSWTIGKRATENRIVLDITRNGSRVACTDGAGGIHVFELSRETNKWKRIVVPQLQGRIFSIVFLDDHGSALAIGTNQNEAGSLMTLNIESGELLRVGNDTSHHDAVHALSGHPSLPLLASASMDGSIRLWDIKESPTRLSRESRTFKTYGEPVLSLALHPTEDRLFSGTHEGSITIWNTRTLTQIVTLSGHIGIVLSLSLDRDGTRLASTSGGYDGLDNVVKIWNAGVPDTLKQAREDSRR